MHLNRTYVLPYPLKELQSQKEEYQCFPCELLGLVLVKLKLKRLTQSSAFKCIHGSLIRKTTIQGDTGEGDRGTDHCNHGPSVIIELELTRKSRGVTRGVIDGILEVIMRGSGSGCVHAAAAVSPYN